MSDNNLDRTDNSGSQYNQEPKTPEMSASTKRNSGGSKIN